MKYFFVSDIHGEYTKLENALKQANFDAATDTLVSVGDPFDRGSQNLQVLEFLMKLPHKIIIIGNHDQDLYYFFFKHQPYTMLNEWNGMGFTVREFEDDPTAMKLLTEYYSIGVYAIEFADLIATHAWVPTDNAFYAIPPFQATNEQWKSAVWADSGDLYNRAKFPSKKLLIGHWHALRFATNPRILDAWENHDYANYEPNSTFFSRNLIAIDGMSNAENGKVNVYIYETDEQPKTYGKID